MSLLSNNNLNNFEHSQGPGMSAAQMYNQLGIQLTGPEIIKPAPKIKTKKKKKKKVTNGRTKASLSDTLEPVTNNAEHSDDVAATYGELSGLDTSLHDDKIQAQDLDTCSALDSSVARDAQLLESHGARDGHVTKTLTNGATPHHTATIESSPASPRDSPALLACNYAGSSASLEHCKEVKDSVDSEPVLFCANLDPTNQNSDPNTSASTLKRKLSKTPNSTSADQTVKKKKKTGNAVRLNKFISVVDQEVGNMTKRSDTLNAKEEAKQLFQWLIHPVKQDQFFK